MAVELRKNSTQAANFDEFYQQHVDSIYRVLRVRAPEHIAEELTAEVFIAALKKWNSAESLQPGWLVTIARRRLIDEWRRQARSRKRQSQLTVAVTTRGTPDETATDDRLLVVTVLDYLPVAQRQALILRYLDDWPVQAIADVLNRSYSATESLLSRSRRNFARHYGEYAERSQHGNAREGM